MLTALRRVLNHDVSIAALIEAAIWLAIPYLLIGLTLTTSQPWRLGLVEHQMEARVARSESFELVAFGLATTLWPALLAAPASCREWPFGQPLS